MCDPTMSQLSNGVESESTQHTKDNNISHTTASLNTLLLICILTTYGLGHEYLASRLFTLIDYVSILSGDESYDSFACNRL